MALDSKLGEFAGYEVFLVKHFILQEHRLP